MGFLISVSGFSKRFVFSVPFWRAMNIKKKLGSCKCRGCKKEVNSGDYYIGGSSSWEVKFCHKCAKVFYENGVKDFQNMVDYFKKQAEWIEVNMERLDKASIVNDL